MVNNAAPLASHKPVAFPSCPSLLIKPIVITSAIAAIFSLGVFYPKPEPNPCDQIVMKEFEGGIFCTGEFAEKCTACDENRLNSSVCEQLNDTEWASLPLKKNFNDFKERFLFSDLKCRQVDNQLCWKIHKDIRKVASEMGIITNLNLLSVNYEDYDGSTKLHGNRVYLSRRDVMKWWNLESSHQRQQIRGILAHEMAHKIKKHHALCMIQPFEAMGVTVSSLDDVVEFISIMYHQQSYSELSLSAKKLYDDIIEKYADKQALASYESALALDTRFQIRQQEIEADLLTLTVPEYARGLRDYFEIAFLNCRQKHDLQYCDEYDSTHPPLRERVAYLTDALCEKHPGLNQDICQCSSSANSTI